MRKVFFHGSEYHSRADRAMVVALIVFCIVDVLFIVTLIPCDHIPDKNEIAYEDGLSLTIHLACDIPIIKTATYSSTCSRGTNMLKHMADIVSVCSNYGGPSLLIDPWGHPYNILITNVDVISLGGRTVTCNWRTAGWSNGRNGSNEYGVGDDINTWESREENITRANGEYSFVHKLVKYVFPK